MIEYIATNIPDILEIIGIVIALAAAIAAVTPTPKDDGVVRKIRKIVDAIGLNVGKAKNKDD